MDWDKIKSGCLITVVLYVLVILLMIVLWVAFLTKPIH